ncbi:MAG: rhomboid family intramembrane serine protease [Duncaniella sp.]|nr:rhomboid family intramembrane serine protease [Duncaniella sp.]MDE6066780.1 rhomboid family intramembrane serine protease [Duncaniella sp.]
MEVIDRLRTTLASSGMLMKIICINIGVFIALRLCAIVCIFSGSPGYIGNILAQVELPSAPSMLLTRPWTILTYMFAQYDLMHIIFNMLWLYWFGTMFRMVAGERQLITLYLYGGIAGAVLFIAGYAVLPFLHGSSGWLIGSSASVIAIVTAVAILMPDVKMHLLFFGAVAVKWIALVTILLVLIGVTGSNAGGEIAHIGGVLTGLLFALRYKKIGYKRSSKKSAVPPQAGNGGLTPDEQRELDTILEKIKKSGYSALTPAERDRLFNVSRRIR